MCDCQINRSTWREYLTLRVNSVKFSISRALETLGVPHTNPRSLKAQKKNLFGWSRIIAVLSYCWWWVLALSPPNVPINTPSVIRVVLNQNLAYRVWARSIRHGWGNSAICWWRIIAIFWNLLWWVLVSSPLNFPINTPSVIRVLLNQMQAHPKFLMWVPKIFLPYAYLNVGKWLHLGTARVSYVKAHNIFILKIWDITVLLAYTCDCLRYLFTDFYTC